MRRHPLEAAFGLFVFGSLVMILFDSWLTRLLGVLCLVAFVVGGVFAIATPALLDDEEAQTDEPGAAQGDR